MTTRSMEPPNDTPAQSVEVNGLTVNALIEKGIVEIHVPVPNQKPAKLHLTPPQATRLSQLLHQGAAIVRRGVHVRPRK